MRALDPQAIERFVPEAERGDLPEGERPTVFLLRNLTGRERYVLRMEAKRDVERQGVDLEQLGLVDTLRFSPELIGRMLERALVGWENFLTADGSPAPFSEDAPAANVDRLDEATFIELGYHVLSRTYVSPDLGNESRSPSPSQPTGERSIAADDHPAHEQATGSAPGSSRTAA